MTQTNCTASPHERLIFPPPGPDDNGWRPQSRAGSLTYRISTRAIGPDMRFGRWITVGEPWHDHLSARWIKAQCDCGTIANVRCANLANGRSKSCGCFHRDRVSADASQSHHNRLSGMIRDVDGNWITT